MAILGGTGRATFAAEEHAAKREEATAGMVSQWGNEADAEMQRKAGGQLSPNVSGTTVATMEKTSGPWSKNPFSMPADEEVFKLRETEKRHKLEQREKVKHMHVHEKTTFASRMGTSLASSAVANVLAEGRVTTSVGALDLATSASAASVARTHSDKENIADFIAKKREIFLVQMSLDTKRAEIRKLEERALEREQALRASEAALEADALKFDAFLKENDEKVQEAIRKAEQEAKLKQEKVSEIKRQNGVVTAIRSDLSKYEEQLEECKKYRDFLAALTPAQWSETQKVEAETRREMRRATRRAERKAKRKAEEEAENARREAAAATAAVLGEEVDEPDATTSGRTTAQDTNDDVSDDEDDDSAGEMFFKDPRQLLEVFSQLEEQNLFLIQNCQETEEGLEELKGKFRDTQERMEGEVQNLRDQIEVLTAAIMSEEEKTRVLADRASGNAFYGVQDTALAQLAAKVLEVYVRDQIGFDNDASVGTLQMLTNFENKLEEYLAIADTMSPKFVEASEKAREKERRQKAREEKMEAQRIEQERRVQRSLERAQAPVHKKTGKPVMFRSQVLQKKKVSDDKGVRKTDEDQELAAFLARDA